MRRHLSRAIGYLAVALVIAAASIAVGLAVTPDQQVEAVGQTIEVGVTGPSTQVSGPGELDLFGQELDTSVEFIGPIRPRIRLTQITLPEQLKNFAATTSGQDDPAESLSNALVSGFRHYLYWQIGVVGVVAILLAGAVSGWMRRGWGFSLAFVASVLALTELINVGAIMSTAYTAPAKLREVHSLQALVGDAPDLQAPPTKPRTSTGYTVVIGDSTAAGLGNSPLPRPTRTDKACRRSIDSFAVALSNVGDTPVTNLACSGATIGAGLIGSQQVGSVVLPPQLSQRALADATTVIVSIGANDVRWSDQLLVCAISVSCQNNAEQAAYQQYLARFSVDYLQLLSALQALPTQPEVVINLYYDPFGDSVDCLSDVGVTVEKQQAVLSKLAALNEILRAGADAASFKTAAPNFAGHGLCSATPFVQGVDAKAPFHPTTGGEVAIALAVERALRTDS